MIADFHTHTFPDQIAPAAVSRLQAASHIRAFADGTASGLRAAMRRAGIDVSLVLPVATNTRQVEKVNDSAVRMNDAAGETGLYSFGCLHPACENWKEELARLARAGVRGVKLHPYFQETDADDPRYLRILDRCGQLDMTVLIHAGLDVGFPGQDRASPAILRRAVLSVGPVRLVLAHMGGWRCWDEAEQQLTGLGLYIDTSFSLGSMTPADDGFQRSREESAMLSGERFVRMVRSFGADHVLFGTDCPWGDQAECLALFRALPLSDEEKQAILWDNAARLLGLPCPPNVNRHETARRFAPGK